MVEGVSKLWQKALKRPLELLWAMPAFVLWADGRMAGRKAWGVSWSPFHSQKLSSKRPAPWKPPGQLLHSSEGRVIPVWPRSFKNPTWDTERPAWNVKAEEVACGCKDSSAPGDDSSSTGQTVHLLGSWHLALMVQSHLLLPEVYQPSLLLCLPCLCRFPSQIGPQFRVKYSDFSKQCFYIQLIIQVYQTFLKRAFILATKSK